MMVRSRFLVGVPVFDGVNSHGWRFNPRLWSQSIQNVTGLRSLIVTWTQMKVWKMMFLLETPRLASFHLSYRDIHKSCGWLGYLSEKNKSLPLSNHQLLLVIYDPIQEIYHMRKLINEPPAPQIMESEKVVPLSYKLVYNPETIPVPIYHYISTYLRIYICISVQPKP